MTNIKETISNLNTMINMHSYLRDDKNYGQIVVRNKRELYKDLGNSVKTDKDILEYMTRDFNPNDELVFDKERIANDQEYKDIYDKYILDRKKLNYYKTYINIFCQSMVSPEQMDEAVEASKDLTEADFDTIDRVIRFCPGYSHYSRDNDIYREIHGLNDGYEKSYEEAAVRFHNSASFIKEIDSKKQRSIVKAVNLIRFKNQDFDLEERKDFRTVLDRCSNVFNNDSKVLELKSE